jgi:hypothetical protein
MKFYIDKDNLVNINENDIEKFNTISYYNDGILVTDNLHSVYKTFLLRDFISFVNLKIFSNI